MTLWIAMLLGVALAAGPSPETVRLVDQGEAALRSGDLVAAMRAFQTALEQAPGAWEVHDGLGRAWRAAGDLEAAQRELRRAVTLAPADGRGRPGGHLADLVEVLADLDERREGWAWISEHVAGSLDVQLRVAVEARRAGDLGLAGAALERAKKLDPDHMQVQIEQIRVSRDSLDYAHAEELAQAFIRRYPQYAETYVQLGRIYQLQDRLDEAAARYTQGLELDPGHVTALYRLGEIRMRQGALEEAKTVLERAVGVAPELYQAHYLLGQVHLRLGDREAARRELAIFQRIKDERRAHTRLAGGASMEPD